MLRNINKKRTPKNVQNLGVLFDGLLQVIR
jgi:hypothetical protein